MDCCNKDAIILVRGNDTDFNGQHLLKLRITGILDLADLKASFTLVDVEKTFDDLTSGEIIVDYSASETAEFPIGIIYGDLRVESRSGKIATLENRIPFKVISVVHGDAIATEPFEMTINVEQGGENILNIEVKSYLMKIEVGEVETLPAGSNAYVTNTGTANEAIFNFGIPKGADGKDGIDGKDATINGVSTLTLTASDGLTLEQEGSVANISGATLSGQISDINDLIPEQASSSNQLADKEFVNSSIATNTGNFIGTFNSVEERDAYTGDITNNDYCFVVNGVVLDNGNDWSSFSDLDGYDKNLLTNYDYAWIIDGNKFDLYRFDIVNQVWELRAEDIEKDDVSLNTAYNRYKATVAEGSITWEYEYTLNNSSFTANQWEAINSGATQENIAQISTNKNAIGTLSSLTTTDKSSLVGAVNELNSSKQATITGGASTITSANLTANRALISNAQGKVAVSPVTNTELGYLSGATSSIQTQLNRKASTSLDNLSDAGQMIIDSQNGTISNCITEIPQDIKLELNNGTLTLKSGSIVTFADGSQYQLTSNKSTSWWATQITDGQVYFVTDSSGLLAWTRYPAISDTTEPTKQAGLLWYDTTNNSVKRCDGANWQERSLPICIATVTNSVITSIDKVFNGFGYIGSTAFALPGVKGLVPNGLNTDGTLKNLAFTINSLLITTDVSGATGKLEYYVNSVGIYRSNVGANTYNPETNYITNTSGTIQVVTLIDENAYRTGGKVTSFNPKAVRLATTEMLDKKQNTLTFDTTPTQNSTNPVTSGGVYTALSSKANTSLNNLDSTGQMVIDSQNGTISNCILDIPQNLKLTLENGVFTIKAGTVLTGTGTTDRTLTTTQDRVVDYNSILPNVGNGKYVIFVTYNSTATLNSGQWYPMTKCYSGDTLPDPTTISQNSMFYLTTDRKIYIQGNPMSTGAWTETSLAYPLGIFEVNNHQLSFAQNSYGNDMIFNGSGYIGHHAFVLPGVKALASNGFNANGTLASVSLTTDILYISDISDNTRNLGIFLESNHSSVYNSLLNYTEVDTFDEVKAISTGGTWRYTFCRETNSIWLWNASTLSEQTPRKLFISHHYENGVITQFDVCQPVRLATTEMLDNKQDTITGISGYDSTKTQTLKNLNGVLTWVTD